VETVKICIVYYRNDAGPLAHPKEPLNPRVFIDKRVVEVFVNGRQCVALRVYPGRKDSVGISFRTQGQEAQLRSLDARQMKNIHE